MNILHIYPGLSYGGIESMLVTLARERAACPELQPSFALNFPGRCTDELIATGAAVHHLGSARIRSPWQLLQTRSRLAALIRDTSFDAVICHASWALALYGGVVRNAGRPLVFWMHNNSTRGPTHIGETWAGLQKPDLAICNSRFTASTLPLLFARQIPRHTVIACPVSHPSSAEVSLERKWALRAELNTTQDAVVIILASRMERWKGHTLLLDALASLRREPGWKCWIVGGGAGPKEQDFLTELTGQTQRLGISDRVVFTGRRNDVPALMGAADIYCQPNLDPEPFGIAFVEALYAGVPVVSADHGGAAEIVDATCGRLVPPGDVTALAEALRELVRDSGLRQALGAAAAKHGAEVSGPEVVLPKIQEAIALALANRKGRSDDQANRTLSRSR